MKFEKTSPGPTFTKNIMYLCPVYISFPSFPPRFPCPGGISWDIAGNFLKSSVTGNLLKGQKFSWKNCMIKKSYMMHVCMYIYHYHL